MIAADPGPPTTRRQAQSWRLRPPFRAIHFALAAILFGLVLWSAQRQGIGDAVVLTSRALTAWSGGDESDLGRASGRMAEGFWPPQLSEEIPLAEWLGQEDRLPWLARIESRERSVMRVDPATLAVERRVETEEVLVRPLGYAQRVAVRMLETLEIGLLATLIGVLWSVPLAILGARGYAPGTWVRQGARALVAMLRAVPELISALFLVLAYGFGPAAGVLALALHCTGFLGKFFAEEIEHADKAPQQALAAHGAGRLKVLRYAVWPQVMPHYAGYVCYVLDRNVRMATVVGLVGAGGIGQELKGRYDLFQFGHVSTILLAIFLVVLALDQLSAWVRARSE